MDPLRLVAARSPAAPAVLEGGGSALSYGELDRWAAGIAAGLGGSGLATGDLVAVALPWSAESVALHHALWRLGAAVLPLNLAWSDAEREAGIGAAGGVARLIDARSPLTGPVARAVRRETGEACADTASHLAARVLTSGSTGTPRAVPITHGNLRASAAAVIGCLGLRPWDRWATTLAPGHIGGLAMLHRAAVAGCALVAENGFDARRLRGRIFSGEVTHAALVPVMLARLLDECGERPPPPSLCCLLLGGASVPAPLLERALALGYPVAHTYGLTEATSQVATAEPARVMAKPGTVGRPLSGVEVRIEPDPGSAGGRGEIRVRGPTVPCELLEGGWLRTGDIGWRDTDGDLWVTGRISDRIITGGVTVSPAEVESVLGGHPAVREAAVFGVPDPEWGERVVALVVPEDPARPPDLATLLDHARPRLAPPKRPREVRIAPAIPRTATGKPDRTSLAAR